MTGKSMNNVDEYIIRSLWDYLTVGLFPEKHFMLLYGFYFWLGNLENFYEWCFFVVYSNWLIWRNEISGSYQNVECYL